VEQQLEVMLAAVVEALRLVEQQLEVMLAAVVEAQRLVEQQLEVMLVAVVKALRLVVMLEVEVERLGAQQVKEQVPVWRVILEIKVQNC
jgi:hypothetical protein